MFTCMFRSKFVNNQVTNCLTGNGKIREHYWGTFQDRLRKMTNTQHDSGLSAKETARVPTKYNPSWRHWTLSNVRVLPARSENTNAPWEGFISNIKSILMILLGSILQTSRFKARSQDNLQLLGCSWFFSDPPSKHINIATKYDSPHPF